MPRIGSHRVRQVNERALENANIRLEDCERALLEAKEELEASKTDLAQQTEITNTTLQELEQVRQDLRAAKRKARTE